MGLSTFLATHDISHHTSPPHTSKHNGFSERRHRHIVETGLALLPRASLPLSFLSYAFLKATYLINRLPTPALHMSSLYRSLGLLPINSNSVSLVVYVIHGLDLTWCTNSLLVPPLVSSLATRLPKVPTYIMTFPPQDPSLPSCSLH